MIHRAKFQNFKALRDVEITFDSRLTVLVGPNGSGKTSVLQGIHILSLLASGFPPEGIFANEFSLDYLVQPRRSLRLELETSTPSKDRVVAVVEPLRRDASPRTPSWKLQLDQTSRLRPGNQPGPKTVELPGVFNHPTPPVNAAFPGNGLPESSESSSPQRRAIPTTELLRLNPSTLASPSVPTADSVRMRPDGEGLASSLAYLRLNQPERFDAITRNLQAIVHGVTALRFDREVVMNRGQLGEVLLLDTTNAKGIRASSASEGTLLTIGFLAAILGPASPDVLLLDDLDRALHPKAQLKLVESLRALLDQLPDLQIIATSHSPYILDKLKPNEVRVMAIQDDGSAICKPLTDHPDFERWKESMSPGEFWTTFYEDWLTKTHKPQPVS